LLQRFMGDARRAGAEQMFLEVRISNVPAIGLYEASGFEAVGRRHAYYPATPRAAAEDALVMRRTLVEPAVPGRGPTR
jgi:ribosomal-protein-alanine N-acetyltransferase